MQAFASRTERVAQAHEHATAPARPGLQPGAGHLRGRRLGAARHRRPRHRAQRPRVPSRADLDRLRDERARRRRLARATAGAPSRSPRPAGGDYLVRLVESAPEAYDRFYNIFANPMLWFIQHYLWDLSNAPDIRRNEIEAFEFGYNVVNEDLARAVVEEIEDVEDPVVMVHDYHLYTLPELVRRARPDVFLHHFVHIPWTQPDAWRVLPTRIRQELYSGPARQRHHRLPHPVLPAQLPAVLPRAGRRRDRRRTQRRALGGARGVGRAPTRCRSTTPRRSQPRSAPRVAEFEAELAAPPARLHDPARRPRRPLQERAARLLRVRHSSSSSTPSTPSA